MSTISSNADITTKYQRVAAEYAKLKVHVAALKNAVIAEQEKNQKLSADLHSSESAVRKLQNEKEGFEFRNSQLVKRVEALQYEIDNAKQTSGRKRGLLFQKNSRTEHPAAPDSHVLQLELQKKVTENETLHMKISELESEYTETTAALEEQYRKLEIENGKLKEEIGRIRTDATSNQSLFPNTTESSKSQPAVTNVTSMVGEGVAASQNLVLRCERAVAMKETLQVLWLDALRTARTLTAGFANLLQLLEQRSTIYPNDINMEKLPERTLLFGRRLLSSCDMFEACSSSIESILVKSAEDDCLNLSAECSKIAPTVTGALCSCREWQDLFYESILDESRLSWCGTKLGKFNEDWTNAFLAFLRFLAALSGQIGRADDQSSLELLVQVEKLPALSADCSRAYAAKIFDENHIPTASKRLRCINECINKCLASLHRNLNSFVALVQLIVSSNQVQGEEVVNASGCATEVPCVLSNPNTQNNCMKEEVHESGDQVHVEPETLNNCSCRPTNDFLKTEVCIIAFLQSYNIEIATKRIVELEKEKERIIVDSELLKKKLESVKLGVVRSEVPSNDRDVICSYFQERIGDLHADIEHIRSRALYYKHECKDLLKLEKLLKEENEALREEVNGATAIASSLKEELEMTRKSYEEQLQNLHEHIADLNIKLEEQSKALKSFKDVFNGVTSAKQSSRKPVLK